MNRTQIQKKYNIYQTLKHELQGKYKPKKIYYPLGIWLSKKLPLRNATILDVGCLIESNLYNTYKRSNDNTKGYYGYDIDDDTIHWLKKDRRYFDIYNEKPDKKFDYIFLVDVYEHLEPDERIKILKTIPDFLKPGGKLCLIFPYTGNLNYFENFIGDWTHKIVKLENEPPAIIAYGGFKPENVKTYLGGLSLPRESIFHNLACIWRNLINLYPPFHVSIIIAEMEVAKSPK